MLIPIILPTSGVGETIKLLTIAIFFILILVLHIWLFQKYTKQVIVMRCELEKKLAEGCLYISAIDKDYFVIECQSNKTVHKLNYAKLRGWLSHIRKRMRDR
jgi:hypothetical protein